MTQPLDEQAMALEKYREYLCILARVQMHPHLAGKLAPSDVVQQTLLKAHEKREQYHGKTDAERAGWLRAILVNTLREEARKFGRQQRDVGLERSLEAGLDQSSARLEKLLAADQSSPSQKAIGEERLLQLAQALASLPEDQRTVVEMRHLQGLAIAVIAQAQGRSEASVAGLIRRGLQALREQLKVFEDP